MQVFDINLEPGKVRLIDQLADNIYFLNGSAGGGDTTIVIRPESGGDAVYLKPGQAYKFNAGEAAPRWSIRNHKGEGTIVGQLLFSVGTFTDNRVSGSVEVIDGGKNRVSAGVTYSLSAAPSAQAGLINHVQLWNPVGSGKNLVVSQVIVGTSAFDIVAFKFHNAALATLAGNVLNKKAGAAASIAESRSQRDAAVLTPGAALVFATCNGSSSNLIKPTEPFLLPPGNGLVVHNATANVALYATIEHYEESV